MGCYILKIHAKYMKSKCLYILRARVYACVRACVRARARARACVCVCVCVSTSVHYTCIYPLIISIYIHPYTHLGLFVYAASYRWTLMLRSVVNYANNSAGNVSGCGRRSIHRLATGSVRPLVQKRTTDGAGTCGKRARRERETANEIAKGRKEA